MNVRVRSLQCGETTRFRFDVPSIQESKISSSSTVAVNYLDQWRQVLAAGAGNTNEEIH